MRRSGAVKMPSLPCPALPRLCRDLKRHLLSVEERCLESLAWQRGSSLYAALAAAVGPAAGTAAPASSQAGQSEGEQAAGSQGSAGQGGGGGGGGGGGSGVTPRKRGHGEMAAAEADPDAEMAEAAPGPAAAPAAAQQAQQAEAEPRAQAALPLSLGAETSGAGAAAVAESSGDAQQPGGQPDAATWQHPSLAARGDRSARAAVSCCCGAPYLACCQRDVAACCLARPVGRPSQPWLLPGPAPAEPLPVLLSGQAAHTSRTLVRVFDSQPPAMDPWWRPCCFPT